MKKKIILIALVCMVCVAAVCIFVLTKNEGLDRNNFPSNTSINGVDCSGLTVDEARSRLAAEWNSRKFTIKSEDGAAGEISDLSLEYSIEKEIRDRLKPGLWGGLVRLFSKSGMKYKVDMTAKTIPESFREKVGAMAFLNGGDVVETKDAYVDKRTNAFNIVKEVYGENVNIELLIKDILGNIAKGKFDMLFQRNKYLIKPKVRSNDKRLLKEQAFYKKYLSQAITYNLSSGQRIITPLELEKMKVVAANGGVTINNEAVKAFVAALASSVDTIGKPKPFRTALGRDITVYRGNYGYQLNQVKEVEQLTAELGSGENVTREPLYSSRAYVNGVNEIGGSYVEIDLSNQMVYLYQNGEILLKSPTVTGNVKMGSQTPPGVYRLAYKKRKTVLRGRDYDGSRYESPVEYWMPFNGEIGLHDADWVKKFGGDVYVNNGSHGCVNLPLSAATTIFSNIRPGFPVVVHH